MATNRQTVVAPLGWIETPNKVGQYPAGALAAASNAVIRAPGLITPAPGFLAQVQFGASDETVRKLYPLDAGKVFYWSRSSGLVWNVGGATTGVSSTFPAGVSSTGLFFDTGQIWPVRLRERMLVNTANAGALVLDSMAPATAPQHALRYAGMPQPSVSVNALSGGSVPQNVSVAYCALLKRTFSDSYSIFSVPSPGRRITNTTGLVVDIRITARWPTGGVIAGDVLEVYRTDGLPNATGDTDPGDTFKLVVARTLTSSDVTAGFVQVLDTNIVQSPFYQTTGRELYTNPGQETALQANRQPNISAAQATFKNYVFYGDITERPAWTFAIPAGVGINDIPPSPANAWFRANGIGRHRGAATITTGSPTATGISATDIVGVKVGQIIAFGGSGFPANSTVIAVGASSFTASANAASNNTTFDVFDRILLDGVPILFGDYGSLVADAGIANYEVTTDANVSVNSVVYVTGVTTTIEPTRPNKATMTVAATNGANYQPPVPEYNATAQTFSRTRTPNLLQWSKDSEPEHVPPSNETKVGAGTIIAMAATKNALWIFCTDGLYRLSGDGPPWRLDLMDPSCIIVAPQALTQFRDTIFAYTNYGMVAITDGGIDEFTTNILDARFPGPPFSSNPLVIVERNEFDSEIVVSQGEGFLYVFNTVQKAWSSVTNFGDTFTLSPGITNIVTALAFQRSPSSGRASLLVGNSPLGGSPPAFTSWSSNTALNSSVTFQPFYGTDVDPLAMKQFVDVTYIFARTNAGLSVIANISPPNPNVDLSLHTVTLVAHGADAYGTIGVTRNCSILQSITPGFQTANDNYEFRGISVRYVLLTDQAWRK